MAKWLVIGEGKELTAIRLCEIVAVSSRNIPGFRALITLRNRDEFRVADAPNEVFEKIAELERDEQKEESE